MDDLIRRSDAIKAVIEWYGCKPNDIEAFEKIIEAIPSAESTGDLDNAIYEYVKEGLMDNPYDRPQGEWIPFDLKWGREIYACTACGESVEVPTCMGKPLFKFCPNCGAMMKGADDEVTTV